MLAHIRSCLLVPNSCGKIIAHLFRNTIPSINLDEAAQAAVQQGVREGGYSVPLEGLRFIKERLCLAIGAADCPGRAIVFHFSWFLVQFMLLCSEYHYV